MKPINFSRRQFIRTSAVVAGGLAFPYVSTRNVLGANARLNIGGIGVGGKGESDVDGCSRENIVALCDVDERNAAVSFKRFEKAKRYKDYRVMLEKELKNLDAVTISTPDHHHALPALMAMKAGKHVYVQKPLTHTVAEARLLGKVARETGVVTQMGNQGHCQPDSRRLVELIRAGVLGEVREIHVWTDRPIWPQGVDRPVESQSVPSHLDWDLWLGPAPERPYHGDYVPFKWRGWWDFGTGALGDMGCHNMDVAFFALELRNPIRVKAESSDHHAESAPKSSVITYTFQRPGGGRLPLTWYDGGKTPAAALVKLNALPGNGAIFVGTTDTLYVPHYWGAGQFTSGARMEDFGSIPQTLKRFPGAGENNDRAHHEEWIEACKGNGEALSAFDYSAPMTEAVLLGNVALRSGTEVVWDADKMTVTNNPDANRFVTKSYRDGWRLG